MPLNIEQAATICREAMERYGIDCDPYPDYSGKFMYGTRVDGIVTENIAEISVLGWVAAELVAEGELEMRIQDLPRRWDSLGRKHIWY